MVRAKISNCYFLFQKSIQIAGAPNFSCKFLEIYQMEVIHTNTLIVGAGFSGLACAACLKKGKIDYKIIEKEDAVAWPWRHHYERLHLHTPKSLSHLPYKKFNHAIPRYPSRRQVINYLEDYQREFCIHPLRNTEAISIEEEKGNWVTKTNNGVFLSKHIIMATGAYSRPKPVSFNGMETFPGPILHSFQYKTGKEFSGKNVLVVGFGNSACEIAIDLHEQGANVTMSVRSPVNIVPRDVLEIPITQLSLLLQQLKPRIADAVSKPLMSLLLGNITSLGLKRKPYGPLEQFEKEGNPPVLDIGTLQMIRRGFVKICDNIDHITDATVYFSSGQDENFDAIIACIGYYRNYADFLKVPRERFDDLRSRVDKQQYFGKDGLYFCGYWISPTGQIREIASDAKKIAVDISKKERSNV